MADVPLTPGEIYSYGEIKEIHPQHLGIYRKDNVARSILADIGGNSPYANRWVVPSEVLDYVGHGSEKGTDQEWDSFNSALRRAMEQGKRIHVVERLQRDPARYYYHGKWYVLEAREVEEPRTGRRVLRFLISASPEWSGADPVSRDAAPDSIRTPNRVRTEVTRIIRDTQTSDRLKELYGYQCQVCGLTQRKGDGTPYAEAHHIRPLSEGGPDEPQNMLVLCAQHHVDFDYGSIALDPDDCTSLHHRYDASLDGGELISRPDHETDESYARYHFDKYNFQ